MFQNPAFSMSSAASEAISKPEANQIADRNADIDDDAQGHDGDTRKEEKKSFKFK
jgi:hypothetical protein